MQACDASGVANALEDYRWRVGNVLDQRVAPEVRAVPVYPRRRARRVASTDLRLSPGEALSLRDCLGRLLGERNSILGQVMTPSSRFAYETRVAAALSGCEADSDEESALLERVRRSKSTDLAVAGYDVIFNTEEIERFLSPEASPMEMQGVHGGLLGIAALDELVGLVRRGLDGDGVGEAALSASLQRLRESREAGGLLRTAALFVAELEAVAAIIHARLNARPVCLQPRPTPTAEIAETVFHKFYARGVQPDLASLRRELAKLVAVLGQAANVQAAELPRPLTAYLEAVQRLDASLVDASRTHAEAWQRLLGQCGRMPDRSDSDNGA